MSRKRILYAVLNWGLGHATRSVPVIQTLLENGFEPVIASDGTALDFLKEEFPRLHFIKAPEYKISYPKNHFLLPYSLLFQSFEIFHLIQKEKKLTEKLIRQYQICGIISDNRPGFYSKKIPSVYLTHQLNVCAGVLTGIATKIHRFLYRNFDRIWVPDNENFPFLSGKLGHLHKNRDKIKDKIKYIGPLSRFNLEKKYEQEDIDWLIVLSGPEKQRTVMETEMIRNREIFQGKIVLVRGTQKAPEVNLPENWNVINFAKTLTLKNLILRSKKIILRSGYSSIMDLMALRKKAVLVPTPGQFEQEYLARFLSRSNFFPSVSQKNIKNISQIDFNKFHLPRISPGPQIDFKIFK